MKLMRCYLFKLDNQPELNGFCRGVFYDLIGNGVCFSLEGVCGQKQFFVCLEFVYSN